MLNTGIEHNGVFKQIEDMGTLRAEWREENPWRNVQNEYVYQNTEQPFFFFFFFFFLPSNLWNNSEPFSYPHGTISVFCAGPHYKVCYNKDQEKPHCRKWESAQCSGYSSNIYKAHKFIPNVMLCIGVWSSRSSAHYAQLHSKYIVMSFTLV